MENLKLLFTKGGIQYQIQQQKNVLKEEILLCGDENPEEFCTEHLSRILKQQTYKEITVISALNHFTMMPEGFSQHDFGFDLIAYNAPVDKENEELMLALNK